MLTLEKMKAIGIDPKDGLARCMNNEAIYFRLIGMAAGDAAFDRLEAAMAAGDLDAAFAAAHALKGMLGNLGMEPLYRPASELTELLRHKSPGDYGALARTILERRAALKAMIEE